ncbi:MAG: hypothetical protein WBD87_14450 [Candidatus Acidiferrales bacterium]
MSGVAPGFESVVEAAHDFDGFEVDGVLLYEFVLLVASDEGEFVDVLVKIGERKFYGVDAAVFKEREGALVVWLKIMKGDAGKIGDDDVAGFLSGGLR